MACVVFGSLNINGCRDIVKRTALFEHLLIKKLNIVFLQETHTDVDNQLQWRDEWKGQVFLSHGSNTTAGVAILVAVELQAVNPSLFEIITGRLMRLDIDIEGLSFSFFNVYAPNIHTDRIAFFSALNEAIKACPKERIVVLAGDFNCTLNPDIDRNHKEPHPHSAATFKAVVDYHELVDVWREAYPMAKQYTWLKTTTNRISGARLDRVYVQNSQRSRFFRSSIFPFPLSDHHLVSICISNQSIKEQKSYWHFNNRLVQDKFFLHSFTLFWEAWRERKLQFKSLQQWWDIGKLQIKCFCQEYTAHSTKQLKGEIELMEKEILKLNCNIENDAESTENLEQKKILLRNLIEERGRGALVRARFTKLNYMDAPTSFFFSLEKKSGEKKTFKCLRLPDGRQTDDRQEIIQHALLYYQNLYSAEKCDQAAMDWLLNDLPQLPDQHRNNLEQPLTFQELTTSAQEQAEGRSPGFDGLTAEFYKVFWELIGPDLYTVFIECMDSGSLPLSCRRAVITLLPKKGDHSVLKNWRPVSLLGSDYKILSKALTNRMKKCIQTIIHKDQTFCIPDRSIFDNLFLIRDLLGYAELQKLDIGLISLDQEKAFDRVDHSYLLKTLEAFGLGPKFTSGIKLLYTDVYSLLKINGRLTRPFNVERGIRQGCGLSGLLYSIAIEPLLVALRKQLSGISPQISSMTNAMRVKLTAYADDITIFVRSNEDTEWVKSCLKNFQAAASSKVNWDKSSAFLMGQWREQVPPQLPQQCAWNSHGLKILGIFFGKKSYMEKNWDGLMDQTLGRLQRWKWILPQLSYRGRILVINNLTASMLWHRLTVLDPPIALIKCIQKACIDFFWDGFHWLPPGILHLPLDEGGQGLIYIIGKVKAMRLHAAQRLLYNGSTTPWIRFGLALLRTLGGLGYDKQLFLMSPKDVEKIMSVPSFYNSVLKAWGMFKVQRMKEAHFGLDEPLFSNSHFGWPMSCSSSLTSTFKKAGITRIRDIIDLVGAKFRSAFEIKSAVGVKSERLIDSLLKTIKASFPQDLITIIKDELSDELSCMNFPDLGITPNALLNRDNENVYLLSIKGLENMNFHGAGKKILYQSCVKSDFYNELQGRVDSKWRAQLSVPPDLRPSWRLLYKPPLVKRSGDLQWRILHCALPTNTYVSKINPTMSPLCLYCHNPDTVFHAFSKCNNLTLLFKTLSKVLERMGLLFTQTLFIFGYKYVKKWRAKCVFINFLIGQAKLSIWKSFRLRSAGKDCDTHKLFKALVQSRIQVEFLFYKSTQNIHDFEMKWCLEGGCVSLNDGVLSFSW